MKICLTEGSPVCEPRKELVRADGWLNKSDDFERVPHMAAALYPR